LAGIHGYMRPKARQRVAVDISSRETREQINDNGN